MPFSFLYLLLLIALVSFLLGVIQVGLVTLSLGKLGLTTGHAFMLLFGSLLGSVLNIPLFTIRDRKSTRLNSSHMSESRMPSSA